MKKLNHYYHLNRKHTHSSIKQLLTSTPLWSDHVISSKAGCWCCLLIVNVD